MDSLENNSSAGTRPDASARAIAEILAGATEQISQITSELSGATSQIDSFNEKLEAGSLDLDEKDGISAKSLQSRCGSDPVASGDKDLHAKIQQMIQSMQATLKQLDEAVDRVGLGG